MLGYNYSSYSCFLSLIVLTLLQNKISTITMHVVCLLSTIERGQDHVFSLLLRTPLTSLVQKSGLGRSKFEFPIAMSRDSSCSDLLIEKQIVMRLIKSWVRELYNPNFLSIVIVITPPVPFLRSNTKRNALCLPPLLSKPEGLSDMSLSLVPKTYTYRAGNTECSATKNRL
jgi:hypothetical protein